MKEKIHPDYETTNVVCSCGNRFETRSTAGKELHVELCNQCHPFFTGQQKFVDTGGRVQRFSDKFGAAAQAVLKKEAAEKEARRLAAEEATLKSRQEREARTAEKAARAGQYEPKAPKAAAAEATEGETVPVTTEVPGAADKDAIDVGPAGDDTAAKNAE